jgi:NTE family protein
MTTHGLQADLVFEGGGVKGIALAGAYRELAERGYRPACLAGTSAGAIVAALVAAGYRGEEIESLVLHTLRFADFADPALGAHLGRPAEILGLMRHRGMHSGARFRDWLSEQLAAKGITRFGDLRDDGASADSRRYRLQVIASDLTARRMLVLPRDAPVLGVDPDELEVAAAVRMSMSVPVLFDPVIHRNECTGDDHVIVDGALLSNFPVWLFDAPAGIAPRFPTFGLTLERPGQRQSVLPAQAPHGLAADLAADIAYLKAIVETMMEAHDRRALDESTRARTIALPTYGVGAVDFSISDQRRDELFAGGRKAAARFLDEWDFGTYVRRFTPEGPSTTKVRADRSDG